MSENGFEVIGVSSAGEDLDTVAREEQIKTIPLEMSRMISPFKDLKSLWQFYQLCKKEKPDIVHSHTPKAGIVGMLGAKLAGVPIRLHTVAGLPLMEASGIKRKVLDLVEKLTYRCATKVYPNSQGLYDFIRKENYTQPEKLKVIGQGSSNGINTSFFSPEVVTQQTKQNLRQQLGIKAEDFVFVFVGRLVGDKGINELVHAFDQISDANAKLLLVGPEESDLDPLKPETLETIKNNPNILPVGFQSDVRSYFGIADSLVFPSYREGFPNVVMQAGAMGLPSIVTNINGCNEIIEEGVNGTIIPVKDAEALQLAMLKFLNNKEFLQGLKSNARSMIEARYEQKVVWESLLSEYNELIAPG